MKYWWNKKHEEERDQFGRRGWRPDIRTSSVKYEEQTSDLSITMDPEEHNKRAERIIREADDKSAELAERYKPYGEGSWDRWVIHEDYEDFVNGDVDKMYDPMIDDDDDYETEYANMDEEEFIF